MKIIVFVLQDLEYRPVNNFFIPNSLHELGLKVTLADPNTLQIVNGVVTAKTCSFFGGNIGDLHPKMNTSEFHS